ncbi:MAG: response regulator, partial [SAR324 cluster bacterium]|nr:response regulator [SAR324 cluster bacterium]
HWPKDLLLQLVPLSEFRKYSPQSTILQEGAPNDRVYFLIRGEVDVVAGNEHILSLKRKGDIFGEMSIISHKTCAATVIAHTMVDTFSIKANNIGDITDFDASILQNTLYRLFAMILTDKLSLTTEKAKKFEETNRLLHRSNLQLTEEIQERQHAEKQLEQSNQHLHEEIDRRKNTEQQLRIAKHEAESANRSKSMFLANMSHEIRTPLNTITGFSQLLLNQAEKYHLSAEATQYLDGITQSGHHLSELIGNILDLSKIESGKIDIALESINLRLLIQGIFHINKAQALKKNIQLTYHVDPALPDSIYSDRNKLQQILMNFTVNAIKFTSEGKSVKINALREQQNLLLKVIDEGIGIAPEFHSKIFEPFEQVDNTQSRNYSGTGLGLTIVKQLVDMLQGEIGVKSELGKGSEFYVKLPLKEGHSNQDIASDENLPLNFQFAPDSKILVVEDNPPTRQMMNAYFESKGLRAIIVKNAYEFFQKIEEFEPEVILMDVHMPGMDGISAIRKLKASHKHAHIPVLVLSADVFKEQQDQAIAAGAAGFLGKPLRMDVLLRMLSKILRQQSVPIPLSQANLLTPELRGQILEEFKKLSLMPFFDEAELIDQLNKINNICPTEPAWSATLDKIMNSIIHGNEPEFQALLKEWMND